MNDSKYMLEQIEKVKKLNEEYARRHPEEQEAHQKKVAQPFVTNALLDDLLKSQTPKWVNYLTLILVALSLIISAWV